MHTIENLNSLITYAIYSGLSTVHIDVTCIFILKRMVEYPKFEHSLNI